ncbi:ATP-binding cassette domain-containing protein [uncultured Sphingomonas sp.]|uniref:ATP-binding cassette domain-containing protein n=1 Tax=uncultured Sphingomonas sp. TaxID=158754 RepID=UPI0025FC6399|nr:ATP-binding cassette domain-containing protein [uncultured Sphingomonas sp.]
MSTDAAPQLCFEQVTRRYHGVSALDAVSLTVEAGSFIALVGPSGSGKSSLLRLANRLDRPDEGCVLLDGRDVAGMDAVRLRRRIGYVFQNIGLFPHMTVGENVAISPRVAGGAAVDVAAALTEVALPPDFATRLPAQLSGGQQQRVGIARALAGDARLLLMDEPFGALDPVTRDQLGRIIRRLHEQRGLTTILVTHDMAEALLLADRVVVMTAGRIVADATPREMVRGQAGRAAEALLAVPRGQAARLAELGR